ncbi:helix-turn-helix domain containing protein [Pelotomaculum isophthalicicum JI]|uniref:Helix-turn-helix domain containing protein n=1 Tax=Pelotomaculum isophthalicicum JI TaxID=947010 RepID=A0A9X4GYV1_9FIRM|nr:helix-turn-helix domain-containing protein [Pelotomaculum isophthalicicum]MDF9408137.1 helix-turn-helix domain containing protein [Pelotomaculum isophthalicicum JI]
MDHVHSTEIPLFNAYCKECHETISYWPEFVLPYQREPLETHEQAVIEHLQGISISESAARIGYDSRTVSRWIKLTFTQAQALVGHVVRRILRLIGAEILPLAPAVATEATRLLLAWLHSYAGWISFPRLHRLIGLCNLLGMGDWDLWGAPLGKARARVKEASSPG